MDNLSPVKSFIYPNLILISNLSNFSSYHYFQQDHRYDSDFLRTITIVYGIIINFYVFNIPDKLRGNSL